MRPRRRPRAPAKSSRTRIAPCGSEFFISTFLQIAYRSNSKSLGCLSARTVEDEGGPNAAPVARSRNRQSRHNSRRSRWAHGEPSASIASERPGPRWHNNSSMTFGVLIVSLSFGNRCVVGTTAVRDGIGVPVPIDQAGTRSFDQNRLGCCHCRGRGNDSSVEPLRTGPRVRPMGRVAARFASWIGRLSEEVRNWRPPGPCPPVASGRQLLRIRARPPLGVSS